jgi:hypothetical protein
MRRFGSDVAAVLLVGVVGFVLALGISSTLAGCAERSGQSVIADHRALQETVHDTGTAISSADTHAGNAQSAVADAKRIADGIPQASPVVAPLGKADTELSSARSDLRTAKAKADSAESQAKASGEKAASLADRNTALESENAKLEKENGEWRRAWLGGKAWFYIYLIAGLITTITIGLFVAEFFFGANIHPLSWVISLARVAGRGLGNLFRGVAAFVAKLRTPKPPAPAPAIFSATPNT